MDDNLVKLYPLPSAEIPLTGTFLAHNLRQYSQRTGSPYIYANFIVSLDGRIAIAHPSGKGLMVPKAIANERDWRLYQEMAAQADIILSSGRYLRDWAEGRAQEILQIDDPRFSDLRAWRKENGLPPQPDIAFISRSLDFPIPAEITAGGRRFVVVTSSNPDPKRVKEIEAKGGQVCIAGENTVDGGLMIEQLSALGYQTIYSAAGPRILHLLISAGVLDRLYLTYANRLLGGDPFATVLDGPALDPAVGFKIHEVYLDPHGLEGSGQLFVSYNRT